jgi:two-component system, chemotaxis family, protein-glutamate methylesterase/glutaminase
MTNYTKSDAAEPALSGSSGTIEKEAVKPTTRDIVVIGASAGGLQALKVLFSNLPADLKAAVFLVLHLSPNRESMLSELIGMYGHLPTETARDGAKIVPGRVYVAAPDRHLLVERGHIHLSTGPKESRARPSVNALFRSAASAYGPRVIGVVLTGGLDDGTLGLWEIKRRGGIAIVQDPTEAQNKQMPASAAENVPVDYVVRIAEIAPLVTSLTKERIVLNPEETSFSTNEERTGSTCPDCRGPLRLVRHGDLVELRCRVGHSYSPRQAIEAHDEAEDRILWSAVEMLEEGADLAEQLEDSISEKEANLHPRIVAKRKLAERIRAAIEKQA